MTNVYAQLTLGGLYGQCSVFWAFWVFGVFGAFGVFGVFRAFGLTGVVGLTGLTRLSGFSWLPRFTGLTRFTILAGCAARVRVCRVHVRLCVNVNVHARGVVAG